MSSTLYLKRTLIGDGRKYTEEELLLTSSYVVVLAEPGAGKTELLESLAEQLGTRVYTANRFRHTGPREKRSPLVIDAFDELSKIDASGIYQLLSAAESSNPTHVYLSSRSSEWGNASTMAFQEFLGHAPLVVRLSELNEAEQRAIFEDYAPGEEFSRFHAELNRFDLETLLPNPQFLKLFADAYIGSGRHFTDKLSIFGQAVERLAREANATIARTTRSLSPNQKIDLSSEIFAKILLAGAEGIVTSEASEDRTYPLLAALFDQSTEADGVLATRLFKPGDGADQHRPVHKIVAEYCAARFLTRRIEDASDALTMAKLVPIIAPNSAVRDELRGMLGWMASLGNRPIQRASIALDPYAILANGDATQLDQSSKRLLINHLKRAEEDDPYFRRGDYWRRFSVAGFFTDDIVNDVAPLLATGRDGHLRNLILQLLADSTEAGKFEVELTRLVLAPDESTAARLLASRCLYSVDGHDHRVDVASLIFQRSNASLSIAAEIIESLGDAVANRASLAAFFGACASLYPTSVDHRDSTIGDRYFVKSLVRQLSLETVEFLLDEMTRELACSCDKKFYECTCRIGVSKVAGSMLDRYFELAPLPLDPERLWTWMRNLHFTGQMSSEQSKSVEVLRTNGSLRQAIIAQALAPLVGRQEIFECRTKHFDMYSHSGLRFHTEDYRFVVDLAYERENPWLWASFVARHQYYQAKDKVGEDSLRKYMRKQASTKPRLMREWAKINREAARFDHEHRVPSFRHSRRMKRHRRKQEQVRTENMTYLRENRSLVEGGRNWSILARFAEMALISPGDIETEVGDDALVRTALRNCLEFVQHSVPDLFGLARLRCMSQRSYVETIIYASCMEIFRTAGNLDDVDMRILRAVRTGFRVHYDAVEAGEASALRSEVDRLVFADHADSERFLREYIEPQLADHNFPHADVWLLRSDDAFAHLRGPVSIEWLRRFPYLPIGPLGTLFDIAAQHGSREELNAIIEHRCAALISNSTIRDGAIRLKVEREFWFIRAWYFLGSQGEFYWKFLASKKETIHLLREHSGQMSRSDHPYWPRLTPSKVEAVLDAFIGQWPKVDLPSHWGTGSPMGENAYRFLTDVIWLIAADDHNDAIPVLTRLLSDERYLDLHRDLKSIYATQVRKRSLRDFEPPTPDQIVERLDRDAVVTVEGLRQLISEEIQELQDAVDGGEFNSGHRFYEKGERLGEMACAEIVAERLSIKLLSQSITVTPEHQLKAEKRSDFTAAKIISGRRRLVVVEVKGQWHKELYTAASAQLHERYSIHPEAEQQGIYLVLWFGTDEKVADRKNHGINSASELKERIEEALPAELAGLIDVIVLDVSK